MAKKDRDYYYRELESDDGLLENRFWLEAAVLCTLQDYAGEYASLKNVDKIVNKNLSKQDYLDFISMKNETLTKELQYILNT